jgi:hypothetical protein
MKKNRIEYQFRQKSRLKFSTVMKWSVAGSFIGLLIFAILFITGNIGSPLEAFASVPGNDDMANAYVIPTPSSWSSANAEFSTVDGTADQAKPSCWSNGPNFNVWFSFQASSESVTIVLTSGGAYGTLRYPFITIWDSAGNNLACAKYTNATGSLELSYVGLSRGGQYYISVDNYNSTSYRGTFSISLSDLPTYDYPGGAVELNTINNFSSSDAEYSTIDATGDGTKGSCWSNGPNFNRWFRFTATTEYLNFRVITGGSKGTLRYPFIALWDSAMNQIACATYTTASGTLELSGTGLQPGFAYFISVDNYNSASYRGTFSIYIDDQPSYDWIEGALLLPSLDNWSSLDAEYTTIDATGDGNKGSCWSNGPNFNRWFKFSATSEYITFQVKSGGAYGTMRYPFIALWDSAMNQLACANYTNATGTLELSGADLNAGSTYYVSVDNYNSTSYRGTFSIFVDDKPNYNWMAGAVDLPSIDNWRSADAEYTSIDATGDGTKGSCWSNGPNFNRWFSFVATTEFITIQVITGGSYGTMRYPFVALYDSASNEISCATYTTASGTLELSVSGLQAGSRYFISVDNYNSSSYRGTFSLSVDDSPTYDNIAGAYVIPQTSNWISANAEFSTIDATADHIRPTCWTNGPSYNRWFKFTASTEWITLQVRSGGVFGTMQYPFLAVWDSSMTQVACAKYLTATGTLELCTGGLVPGKTYYFSVDNYSSTSYRGSFSISVDDQPTFDFREGAIELTNISTWSSSPAQYSTGFGTSDRLKGSCATNGPNNNVWFKFQSIGPIMQIFVRSGGTYGTLRYPFVTVYNSAGNQLNCVKYLVAQASLGLSLSGITLGETYYISVDNYSGYPGTFSLNTIALSPLPIELTNFTAEQDGEVVKVNWQTASEVNNDYFTIERSVDGINFEAIATLKGAGNSSVALDYTIDDSKPVRGKSFYRLMQTDYDGKFEIFDPVSVNVDGSGEAFRIVSVGPNPFTDLLRINYESDGKRSILVQIYSVSGVGVKQQYLDVDLGSGQVLLNDLGDLVAGMYFLKIENAGIDSEPVRILKK